MKYIAYDYIDTYGNRTQVPAVGSMLTDTYNTNYYTVEELQAFCDQFTAEDNDGTNYWIEEK